MNFIDIGLGAVGTVGAYLLYLGLTSGAPAVWAKLKTWWTSGQTEITAIKGDIASAHAKIAAVAADVATVKAKVGA